MHNEKTILETDIEILNKILFPNSKRLIVFDSMMKNVFSNSETIQYFNKKDELISFLKRTNQKFTFVNFSEESLTETESHIFSEGIIDFSKVNNAYANSFTKFFFINNPDGSIRWVFPQNNSTPCFLNLYNGSGWKSELFVLASKVLNKINYLKPITHGQFSVFFKNNGKFKTSFEEIPFDDFAIFTGTVGENRKAIISLSKNKWCTHFIKIPLTNASLGLVKNEYQQLSNLEKFNYSFTFFPKVNIQESQILVSNVLPKQKNANQAWSTLYWDSLDEMYRFSYRKKSLEGTPIWKTIKDGIAFLEHPVVIKNGLKVKEIEKLIESVSQLFYSINSTKLTSLGIAHGDFTPWNMYVGKNKLHIYDWEMSQYDFPLLFDFYHYFFQKGILIDQNDFQKINQIIDTQLENKKAQQILKSFNIDKEEHLKLYLLYIVCYYLPKYIKQPKLHQQVHWLVSTWFDAFQYFNKKVELNSV